MSSAACAAISAATRHGPSTLDQDLWLDWSLLSQLDVEARLAQLTRWVLDAEALQRHYGLRIPGTIVPPGHGDAHRYQCLKALALFERAPA